MTNSPIADAWQSLDELPRVNPDELRVGVARETRRMRQWLVLEVGLTVVALAGATVYAVYGRDFRSIFLLVDTLVVLALVWTFALRGRRGLWLPATETSHGYLRLQARRARFKSLTAWLALALVVAQLTATIVAGIGISSLQSTAAIAWVAWIVWMQRRAGRELRHNEALLREE